MRYIIVWLTRGNEGTENNHLIVSDTTLEGRLSVGQFQHQVL